MLLKMNPPMVGAICHVNLHITDMSCMVYSLFVMFLRCVCDMVCIQAVFLLSSCAQNQVSLSTYFVHLFYFDTTNNASIVCHSMGEY